MPTIKIHLEQAELDAVERFAAAIKVKPEAVAYAALNRLMLASRDPVVRADIADTWDWHRTNLPLWSDSAGGPHGYEGKPDEEPAPSRYLYTRRDQGESSWLPLPAASLNQQLAPAAYPGIPAL